MSATKADIITRLQKEILLLQGFKSTNNGNVVDMGLGSINDAFPGNTFPLTGVHEFVYSAAEDAAAGSGFLAGLVAALMKGGGACLWISCRRIVFPPALIPFGIAPDKIIFIDLPNKRDMLWAVEEALKCGGLAAVVGEIQELTFIASRRLQLAVEQSRVTGFLLRPESRNPDINACITRWRVTSLPSLSEGVMPGVGFPRWNVELLKVRNGKPGTWEMEWVNGKFRQVHPFAAVIPELQKKTG